MQQEGKDKGKKKKERESATLRGPPCPQERPWLVSELPEFLRFSGPGASLHHVLQNGLNGSLLLATKKQLT